MPRSNRSLVLCLTIAAGLAGCNRAVAPAEADTTRAPSPATRPADDAQLLARGEYMVRIAGCNDCHTPGYAETSGEVPKAQWLVGTPLGWNGPWGTTYPANLRLKLQEMDEAAWLAYSGALHTRPPMPDFAVRTMSEDDRRAIYRFVRSLGPAGQPAPDYVPPGTVPQPPYVQWVLPPANAPKPPAS